MSANVEAAAGLLEDGVGSRLRRGFPLAPLTTFRIGGPAALYLEPESLADLAAVARTVAATKIEVLVLGKGSNVLISDQGVAGLVLRLGRGFRYAGRDGDALTAGAAMPVPALAGVAAQHGLTGLEFGAAIPASLGGAIKMNAGAHSHEMAEVILAVDVFSLAQGKLRRVTASEAGFTYRRSSLLRDDVVVSAAVQLTPGEPEQIRAHMDEAREWRRATQPLAEPNCGSVFKNPEDGAAAALIEAAGLKGAQAGGATVSTKHANFIIAHPGATAADVVALIRLVQDRVEEQAGILLEPEVHLIGAFDQIPR